MSVGGRLKEERARLGFSQVAFARFAGVSKGTQINWEKDDSSPTGNALIAYAEAGADVLYILFGRRQGEPISQRAEADKQAQLDLLEDTLRRCAIIAREEGMTQDQVMEGALIALERVATSTSPDITELARERADDIILANFPSDRGASKRRSARYATQLLQRNTTDAHLRDVIDGAGVQLSQDTRHHLLVLIGDYHIDPKAMLPLLDTLRKHLSSPDDD